MQKQQARAEIASGNAASKPLPEAVISLFFDREFASWK
jgi:hypothetical protein